MKRFLLHLAAAMLCLTGCSGSLHTKPSEKLADISYKYGSLSPLVYTGGAWYSFYFQAADVHDEPYSETFNAWGDYAAWKETALYHIF